MSFIAENILFLRKSLKLPQEDFGKVFGLTRGNVASYERGTEPKIETLIKIVNYFDITVEDVVKKKLSKANIKITPNLTPNNTPNPEKEDKKGTSGDSSGLAEENRHLKELLEEKDRLIAALRETIEAKNETIEAQKGLLKGGESYPEPQSVPADSLADIVTR